MTLDMATDNENILRFIDSLNIQACHAIWLHRFIYQSFYLLLTVIEQPHRAVRTSNRYKIFNCCNTIRNTLRNIDIAMEPFSYFWKKLGVRESSLCCWQISHLLVCHQLARLGNHLFSYLLERTFVLVDNFKKIEFSVYFITRIAQVTGSADDVLGYRLKRTIQ